MNRSLAEIQLYIVPTLVVIVVGVLLWGMSRKSETQQAKSQVNMGSAPPQAAVTPLRPLSTDAAVHRRLLTRTFGPDTPDLTIAYWVSDKFPSIQFTSYHQSFLPFHGNIETTLLTMEDRLFEEAPDHEVPARSRLQTAWTFLHLPARKQDLAIQSFFSGNRLDHHFHLMDEEGRLQRIHVDAETGAELMLGPKWTNYRKSLSALMDEGASPHLVREFKQLSRHEPTRAHAHLWLAHLSSADSQGHGNVGANLAMACEFGLKENLARIARASILERPAMGKSAKDLIEHLKHETGNPALGGFLVAQAAQALDYPSFALAFSEILLEKGLVHGGTSRLVRQMHERGRGAQT